MKKIYLLIIKVFVNRFEASVIVVYEIKNEFFNVFFKLGIDYLIIFIFSALSSIFYRVIVKGI